MHLSLNVGTKVVSFNAQNFVREQAEQLYNKLTSFIAVASESVEAAAPTTPSPKYMPGPFAPVQLPQEASSKKVFVIMSFDPAHRDGYFIAIEPTLKSLGFDPIRVDQIQHNKTVTSEIISQIEGSAFVIADLTGERPNVYYEVGWAHRADKEVVLVARKDTAVHFDVAAINRIEYTDYTELCASLRKRIISIADKLGIETGAADETVGSKPE